MGWDNNPKWSNLNDVVVELRETYNAIDSKLVTKKKKLALGEETVFWSVDQCLSEVEITCHYIRRDEYGYWVKSISELEGPFAYDCPLEFLNQAPVADSGWRECVRSFHSQNRKQTLSNLERN